MNLTELAVHPVASIFPMMSDDEYQGLKDDIDANGQQEPIIVWQKQVIDGRNRLKACVELELKPVWVAIDDDADPVQYVLSHNLHRRHLTESQRAMVGARLRDIYDQQAAERRQSGLKKGTEIPVSDNWRQRENLGKSSEKAGKAVAVSGQSIDRATKVLKEGTLEQIAAVDHGKVSVSKAAKEVKAKAVESSRNASTGTGDKYAAHKVTASEINGLASKVRQWQKDLAEKKRLTGGEYIDIDPIIDKVDVLVRMTRDMAFSGECPACHGKGCKECRKLGWVSVGVAKK